MPGRVHGAALNEQQRDTLAQCADVLIPGGEGMPSAREVDVHGALLGRVLTVRPRAAAALPELLDRLASADGSVAQRLEKMRSADAAAFTTISSVIVGAYFLDDRVRDSIGYPGQGPSEVTFDDETGYLAEGLLDPVLERGLREPRI